MGGYGAIWLILLFFPYFGLFSGPDLNHIVLRAQRKLSARIGFHNRHSLEVFEKIENVMWIFSYFGIFKKVNSQGSKPGRFLQSGENGRGEAGRGTSGCEKGGQGE